MQHTEYKLRIPDDLAVFIRTLHPDLKKKIKASLRIILSDPHSGKSLKDELSGLRSFRVSRFRIIYRIASGKYIEIVAVGPRERIYEATYRLLKKEQISLKKP
jgi:mRNA interferase RelE/StbE